LASICPDLDHLRNTAVFHGDKRGALEMHEPRVSSTSDVRSTSRGAIVSGDLLQYQAVKSRVLRVYANPFVSTEALTGMHVLTGEIRAQKTTELAPLALIDCEHEVLKKVYCRHAPT